MRRAQPALTPAICAGASRNVTQSPPGFASRIPFFFACFFYFFCGPSPFWMYGNNLSDERRGRDRVTEPVAFLSRLACTLGRVLGLGAANVAASPLRRAPLLPFLHIGKKSDEALSNARWPRAASADHLPSRLRESPPSCRLLIPLPCANEWRATGDQSKGGEASTHLALALVPAGIPLMGLLVPPWLLLPPRAGSGRLLVRRSILSNPVALVVRIICRLRRAAALAQPRCTRL